jgi:general secretion pathway protein C
VHSFAHRLVEPAKILVIIGIAYTLATTGWYVISGPAPAALMDSKKASAARTTGKPALSVSEIAARNLFGQADTNDAAPAVFDAPETRLKLTLEGVFQAENPEESAAIVSEQGKPGELFLIGGKLPGSAVLTEVHADRIVLRRGTVFETLRFSDEPAVFTANNFDEPPPNALLGTQGADGSDQYEEQPVYDDTPEATDGSAPDSPRASLLGNTVESTVQNYRDRLQQDPVGTLNSLGIAPVSSSGAQGYRVDTLAASPYLAQTGLQPGDVVLSVNGRPVGDVQQDQAEIDNIVAQGSARLEVQRGSRRFFVTASLK